MVIRSRYGSRERLFEMMKKVNRIYESLLPENKKNELIDNFIEFACGYLGLDNNKPKINISYDDGEASKMSSFGKFTPNDDTILVVAVNRNLADVLRTLGHEMVHYKQNLENRIKMDSNQDGSEIENEANSIAAMMMREFGRNNPIIFE